MKIKITYQDGEVLQARTVEEWVRVLWPQVKVHRSERHLPYLQLYLTVDLPCDTIENRKIARSTARKG